MQIILHLLLSMGCASPAVYCNVLPSSDPAPLQVLYNSTVCNGPDSNTQLTTEGHHHLIASGRPESIFQAYPKLPYESSIGPGVRRARTNSSDHDYAFLLGRLRPGKLEVEEWDAAFVCSLNGVNKAVKERLVLADEALEAKCGSRQTGICFLGNGVAYGRVRLRYPWMRIEEWIGGGERGGMCVGLASVGS
ncbi:hypothetical protein BJ508DRAFT_136609 [Ascobolus immersus RN42]|uniref:Uncharacterized protein n=1 Tax=Ascobolus immersus RN42 TaxID=1160509 RepID=A0A3N4I2Y9_ASCIM|nr:hypothetical protein BJ508DRAFT_136609 [Ascobolus immersus RN42]